jgi:hypothetical protein
MGVLDAIAAARTRWYTNFDIAIGSVEMVEERLAEADFPVELHNDAEGMHLYAPKGEHQAKLDRAKAMIDEARELALEVLEDIP